MLKIGQLGLWRASWVFSSMKALGTRSVWAVGLAAGVLALMPAKAHAILMSDLFFGQTIVVGDKLFSDFQLEFDIGSKSIDFSLIDVTGLFDDPVTALADPGLKFTALGAALTVDFGDFIDFSFNYKVTVLSSHNGIVGASLALTDYILDEFSDGFIQIDDFVFDPSLVGLGTLSVNADTFFGDLTDSIEFGNLAGKRSMVFQEISIFVDSGFDGATTGIFSFEVRKSQIPEPTSLSLFGVGLAGLALMLRWHQRRQTNKALNRRRVQMV